MALTTENVLEAIEQIHKDKPMYGHPLWTGMVENTFNIEQVRYLCKQHGGIPLHNHRFHGRLYVICPDPEWRELIAEVVSKNRYAAWDEKWNTSITFIFVLAPAVCKSNMTLPAVSLRSA